MLTLLSVGAQAAPSTPFRIETRYLDQTLTAAQQAIVQRATQRVAALIRSPFVPVAVDSPANACDAGLPKLKEQVAHLILFVKVKDLGEDLYADATPCELHDDTYLPIYAELELNSNGLGDLPDEDLTDTIIHETLHALGVGTLWTPDERISVSGDSDGKSFIRKAGGQVVYTGPRAVAAYQKLGGHGTAIPLDPDAGHWAGKTVCSEILSGDAGDFTGLVNPISPITLAALEDLGYTVNLAAADRYMLPIKGCDVQSAQVDTSRTASTDQVFYANCAAVRAAGLAPLKHGQPGYRRALDGDGDGLACE
ncbi:excalibur calcium-binding domain-containing protein [Deinococcus sonorensis]|uniref:Excalibur calcium-binding domain-containing protein n=2 Tax=Deinococcus sonorensis TaxID=309891 RepID=A0AAU7UGL3_9DEIO